MEILDLYDENRVFTGKTKKRFEPIEKGLRILVTVTFTVNTRGQIFMTLRSPEKEVCPNLWENNGGAALTGEDSVTAIRRELFEETGILAEKEEFVLLRSYTFEDSFLDVFILCKDVPLDKIRLQEGETCDARWVRIEEYEKVIAEGRMAPPVTARYMDLKPKILAFMNEHKRS